MKEKILALIAAVSAAFAPANTQVSDADIYVGENAYRLTFSDEFDGNALDETKWSLCPQMERQGAGGWWDDSMTSLDGNGNLVLSILRRKEDGRLISGAIRSRGKFEQAYGYYEIRCTLPPVEGAWCAFWLMGDTVYGTGNGGRDGTEIDIMESPYYPQSAINQTLNWDGYGVHHKYEGKKVYGNDLYNGFHTYGLEWTEDEYIYYIDGKETWRTKGGGICENPLYMKVSIEAAKWVSELNEDRLPSEMVVDYVRAYEKIE